MYEAFKKLAIEYGDKEVYAIELLKLLPQWLQGAPVWFDNLTNVWRYECGLPIDRMPEEMQVRELTCTCRFQNLVRGQDT
jgi:hypothetical protein